MKPLSCCCPAAFLRPCPRDDEVGMAAGPPATALPLPKRRSRGTTWHPGLGRGKDPPLSQPAAPGPTPSAPGMSPWAAAVSPARLHAAAVPSAGSPGRGPGSHQPLVTPPKAGDPRPCQLSPGPSPSPAKGPATGALGQGWGWDRCKGQRRTAPVHTRGTFPKASSVRHRLKCSFCAWFRAQGSPEAAMLIRDGRLGETGPGPKEPTSPQITPCLIPSFETRSRSPGAIGCLAPAIA